jgi:hypothetical protein
MSQRSELEAEALQICCSCYYYDISDNIDTASDQDLHDLIADPYLPHRQEEEDMDLSECPQYMQEQAETIRDGLREDGINV